jgi:hypothetical protein
MSALGRALNSKSFRLEKNVAEMDKKINRAQSNGAELLLFNMEMDWSKNDSVLAELARDMEKLRRLLQKKQIELKRELKLCGGETGLNEDKERGRDETGVFFIVDSARAVESDVDLERGLPANWSTQEKWENVKAMVKRGEELRKFMNAMPTGCPHTFSNTLIDMKQLVWLMIKDDVDKDEELASEFSLMRTEGQTDLRSEGQSTGQES